MTDDAPADQQIAEMKKNLDDALKGLQPLIDLVKTVSQEPEGLDAGSISDRQYSWNEHQGNVLGAEMVRFHQDNAPRFAASVSRTIDTEANNYFGMMNADAIINGRKLGWLKALIVVGIPCLFAFILLSNPTTSSELSSWLSKGVNAYVALIFISAIVFMVFLAMRRGQPEPT